ncbi:PREDICTED: coiled-coil domain-containing protein 82 [Gekko japonicus]|uniref:Coiled-coil domain-containing protein 82 n=1 Tax=Gekko japonicus TaxID=146911 RepID=A0ABM1KKV3_GEKJA|nr:PREDICTED: coiled-coil domain-containing protein 82 [Gekko japonicus]XP_015274340.1 PREDICTED: coiled-coil domain-containing protein 82 [Gekko japonicus]XP_015274341.1 PREDICTED: coiled-coil domain-containing protein 82 [Gekko japonicus]
METNSVSGRYETRRSGRAKEPAAKSRVDWNRTKRTRLLDSEEEDDESASASEKDIQTSSEDEGEEEGKSMVDVSKEETTINGSSLPVIKASCDGFTEDDVEEESIVPGKHKRSRSSVIHDDSDGSDDSGIVRKVFAKRSCIVDEEDSSAEQEQHTSPAEEETNRKQKRLMKLRELSQRRSTRARSDGDPHEDAEDDVLILEDTYPSPFNPTDVSDSADDDSMRGLIVEEEEEEEEGKELKQEGSEDDERQLQEKKHTKSRKTLLERYIPDLARPSPSAHLKRIVRAFLINAVDCTFLSSLYEGERQKRYAQEMLASLRYLDNRIVQPRLDNLIARSRWKERYKERVDSYPNVCIVFGNSEERSCQACELQRYCRLTVVLSGKLYNTNTMEIDDFMSHDKQRLKVGIVCGNRTEVYHKLKHFKYKLYQDCCSVMKQDDSQDELLKDKVDRVFSQLEEDGWIQKHYTDLEDYMNDADNFQEEKMD